MIFITSTSVIFKKKHVDRNQEMLGTIENSREQPVTVRVSEDMAEKAETNGKSQDMSCHQLVWKWVNERPM